MGEGDSCDDPEALLHPQELGGIYRENFQFFYGLC